MNRHSKNRRHGDPVQAPGSLTDQINQDRNVTNTKNRQKQKRKFDDDEEEEQIIDDRLSRKIIQQAREQQNEFDNDELLAISKEETDLESIERINKIKKNRTEDSDEDDLNAEEDDYDDEEISINEEDEKALEAFMSGQPRRLLGDIIAEKQAQNQSSPDNDLDPRISSMYEQVGQILAHYRSGKIPKAFKILP
ncbi:unnamed protein product, partial [Rotaria sp. Silwood1]